MEKPLKILYINGNIMKRGGIEAFMMNYFRYIDKAIIHIDFVVHGYEKGVYDDEIIQAGSKIYHVPTKSKHPIKYNILLRKIISSGEYQIIHSHLDAMSCWVLKIAKRSGVPVRIAHSHNMQHLTTNKLKFAINEYARKYINKYATHRFACSKEAGRWLFGTEKFDIVKNAINIQPFLFSQINRENKRREYGIKSDTFVIGHVGRFDTQKNHDFLVEVFKTFHTEVPNSKLVLIGDGWLQPDIEEKVRNYGLNSDVIFTGSRGDVNTLYNMMDVFVLPSLFEGLGIVLIEAQTNGLKCIAANEVPHVVSIDNRINFIKLEEDLWVSELKKIQTACGRKNVEVDIKKAGYDIYVAAKLLQEKYLSFMKDALNKRLL